MQIVFQNRVIPMVQWLEQNTKINAFICLTVQNKTAPNVIKFVFITQITIKEILFVASEYAQRLRHSDKRLIQLI